MDFLYINKSSDPVKVSRLNSSSVDEAISTLTANKITNFVLYLNLSDDDFAKMLSRLDALEQETQALKSIVNDLSKVPVGGVQPDHTIKQVDQNRAKQSEAIRMELLEKKLGSSHPLLDSLDRMCFTIRVHNLTEQPVRAIKGSIVFTDLFDADVFRLSVTINEKLKPHGNVTWKGEMPYNLFIEPQNIFAGFAKDDLKLVFEEENIIFG